MGMMKFEVSHSLPRDEAKRRIERLVKYWNAKYSVNGAWDDRGCNLTGKAMGISLNGRLEVTDSKVGGEASDPGMLFRGKAKDYLTKKFAEYLDPKAKPEDLPVA